MTESIKKQHLSRQKMQHWANRSLPFLDAIKREWERPYHLAQFGDSVAERLNTKSYHQLTVLVDRAIQVWALSFIQWRYATLLSIPKHLVPESYLIKAMEKFNEHGFYDIHSAASKWMPGDFYRIFFASVVLLDTFILQDVKPLQELQAARRDARKARRIERRTRVTVAIKPTIDTTLAHPFI